MKLPAAEAARRKIEAGLLAQIAHAETVQLTDHKIRFVAPANVENFADFYLENPDATIVSGATDVGLWVTKQQRYLPTMLWTGRVSGFAGIDHKAGLLRIGPAVTHQHALADLAARWPDLGEVMRRFGSLQVRSSGTMCGNIANGSPIGDLPPMLIALGTEVELTAGKTSRRLPLEAFFKDYGVQDRRNGEFVSALLIPADAGDNLRCYKISKRFDQDISAVMGAFNVTVEKGVITAARIAFGGMAAIPKRAASLETALVGAPLDVQSFRAAAARLEDDFTPISDMRASARYRMQVARNLVLKYGLDLADGKPLRLAGQAGLALAESWS
jgi:xanthine dehydrogenase small subunit